MWRDALAWFNRMHFNLKVALSCWAGGASGYALRGEWAMVAVYACCLGMLLVAQYWFDKYQQACDLLREASRIMHHHRRRICHLEVHEEQLKRWKTEAENVVGAARMVIRGRK